MCKKLLKVIGKIFLAGVTAVVILSLFMLVYTYSPVHIPNDGGNTDYVWPSGSFWSNMFEGIGFGRFDDNGFNNPEVVENPDILILGSSHTEGKSVLQSQNYASLLAANFDGKYSVYNQGISGHHIYKVCQYLETSITQFDKVPKYIVIETSDVTLSEEKVQQVISHEVEYTVSHNTGVIALLQKVPFLHQVYSQLDSGLLDLFMDEGNGFGVDVKKASLVMISSENADSGDDDFSKNASIESDPYETLLSYVRSLQEEYGTHVIIFYHPTGELKSDGTIEYPSGEAQRLFSEASQRNGIKFIDLTADFERMFYDEHQVAHGFSNTELCLGHLNKYGNVAVADGIYDAIISMDEAE